MKLKRFTKLVYAIFTQLKRSEKSISSVYNINLLNNMLDACLQITLITLFECDVVLFLYELQTGKSVCSSGI